MFFSSSQPSYPPQTRHTRPLHQQVVASASTPSKSPPQKMNSLEDRLSPQLFIAMSVNPGGRPVEVVTLSLYGRLVDVAETTLLSVREILGSTPRPVKSDKVFPTVLLRCDVSSEFEAVLPRR